MIAANSISRATSALERASREISIPKIAPTSPEQTRATSSVNPARATPHRPDTPRSVSITSDVGAGPTQPHRLLGQPVLAGRGLGVVAHLRHRRLPQVDHRQPVAVDAGDLRLAVHRRPPRLAIVMFANTVTASPRKASARTGLGAAPVIGYLSSRLASSSALIVEISASTASTSVPVCTQRLTTSSSAAGTYRSRPRPAVFGAKYDIGAVRFALGAPAAGLAAPPCLLHQRPGQQRLRFAQPGH